MPKLGHVPGLLVVCALVVTSGCRAPHQGWEPPLEETSTRFLQNETNKALQAVRDARDDVRSDPALAEAQLDGAVRALMRMSVYYLPLLEAREHAYDAHRFLYYGEGRRAQGELQAIEDKLGAITEAASPSVRIALRESLDLATEAKAEVLAPNDETPELIKRLAVRLNLMALKGGLELPDDWPPTGD